MGALALGACTGGENPLPPSGLQLFEGPVVTPLALSDDGNTLVRVNPLQNSVTVFDRSGVSDPVDIPVGLEPVSAAFRPGDSNVVLVVNHLSDSISVVDIAAQNVVQTIQALDANGVTTTNEPTGIAFGGADRAFVTLDQPNEVIAIDRSGTGTWSIHPIRMYIRSQGPRALAVAGNRLYVAAFESGNRTMTASCSTVDPVPYPCSGTPAPEGVRLPIEVDPDAPDSDLFVYDVTQLDAPVPPLDEGGYLATIQVVEGLGTLHYGMAVTSSQRVYLTQTEALNASNGDVLLANRMFENRLARIDCTTACGSPSIVNLDPAGSSPPYTVPTPYGVDVSGDGATVVVTASGADTAISMPGLFVLDANGAQLGRVMVGDIPQGVVLESGPTGVAETAYVWNSISGSVSVVDVSAPAAPVVTETLAGPGSVLPSSIHLGRKLFKSARASTSRTFSCESCHPNGHTDQLAWVINTPGKPVLNAPAWDTNPATLEPESRVTLSVRGLRDTLPLHWDGRLGKPEDPPPDEEQFGPGVRPVGQSCNFLETTEPSLVDVDCFLDLVDASLAGVMCSLTSCPTTGGKPGALVNADRVRMAAYLTAVAPQPGPLRRPDDALSPEAVQGLGSLIVEPNSTINAGGCSKGAGQGCHEFPLGTPPDIAGLFAAQPGPWRTMWDRFQIASNAGVSSHSRLMADQELFEYDPAWGPSERSSYGSFIQANFGLQKLTTDRQFLFLREMSSGYSGLIGRQLTLTKAMVDTPAERTDVLAQLRVFEEAAEQGRINAVGRLTMFQLGEHVVLDGAYNVDKPVPCWELTETTSTCYPTSFLLTTFGDGLPADARVTIRADLPGNVGQAPTGFATADQRQLLIRYDLETIGTSGRDFIELAEGGPWAFAIESYYLTDTDATWIYIDGVRCAADACSIEVEEGVANAPKSTWITIESDAFDPMPGIGIHALQIQAHRGYFSNEIPLKVE